MSDVRKSIAKNIRLYREQKGMSQKELADAIGVTTGAISNWEKELNSPDIDRLMDMCKLFDIKVTTMYGLSEDAEKRAQALYSAYMSAPGHIKDSVEAALRLNRPIPAPEGHPVDKEQ